MMLWTARMHPPKNSHVETLIPNVTLFGGGAFGR